MKNTKINQITFNFISYLWDHIQPGGRQFEWVSERGNSLSNAFKSISKEFCMLNEFSAWLRLQLAIWLFNAIQMKREYTPENWFYKTFNLNGFDNHSFS